MRRVDRDRGRRWHLGQRSAVRPAEAECTIWVSFDQKAFFVDRPVVPPTEQGEVRERREATLSPVPDVMPLTEPDAAPWEAAAAVAMLERPA